MPALLVKLLGLVAPYLAAAVLGLGGLLYVAHLRGDITAARTENAALMQTDQADAAAIASYKAQEARYNAALDALDAQALATTSATTRIITRIDAQPATADAPVAPVLGDALTEIAKLQQAAP